MQNFAKMCKICQKSSKTKQNCAKMRRIAGKNLHRRRLQRLHLFPSLYIYHDNQIVVLCWRQELIVKNTILILIPLNLILGKFIITLPFVVRSLTKYQITTVVSKIYLCKNLFIYNLFLNRVFINCCNKL